MNKTLDNFKNKHAGETIYLIGCSPSLNVLSKEERDFLKDKTTIGVNFAIEGIEKLRYSISAHITPAVYIHEYFPHEELTLFVSNSGQRKEAFSHMDEFWGSKRIIPFSSEPPKIPLTLEKDILNGNTSILLMSTHLAYIMGAKQLIYIGFEETTRKHFWSDKPEIENKIVNNIEKILESKKYLSDKFYQDDPWNRCHNVHKEFEFMLGKIPNVPSCHFFLDKNRANQNFWDSEWLPPAKENIDNFKLYNFFLQNSRIKTFTRSVDGITVLSGCEKIETVLNT